MNNTLEQQLERALAKGRTDDDFVVKQLRRQIATEKTGKSFRELYVTGSVSPKSRQNQTVELDMEAGWGV